MRNLKPAFILGICLVLFTSTAKAQTELTFYTTKGVIKVMLTDTLTPRTVDSFKARVKKKFYDGLTFHRVVAGFVIQGGDPHGDGTGNPGYYTPDEIVSSLHNNTGTIAMANAGPNTNGCQFYFNLVNNNSLDGHYTVFGAVTSGLTVVQTIGGVAVDTHDKPLTTVYMDSVRITNAPAAVSNVYASINIEVYPNPGTGLYTAYLPDIPTRVEIVNMRGQVVFHAQAQKNTVIDLRDQPKGIYIIHTANELGTGRSKLVLQ